MINYDLINLTDLEASFLVFTGNNNSNWNGAGNTRMCPRYLGSADVDLDNVSLAFGEAFEIATNADSVETCIYLKIIGGISYSGQLVDAHIPIININHGKIEINPTFV